MKQQEKIENIINLPIILFIVIFINYFPLIIKNAKTKESFGVGNFQMLICFIIEIIILCIYFLINFIKNKEEFILNKEIKTNILLLVITTIVLMCVQVYNFLSNKLNFMDILNIGCIFINIFILYICVLNLKIKQEHIYNFFKGIVFFTLIACIVNLALYYKDIYELFVNGKYKWNIMIKSFFANRNQFAFFLYLGIIADFMLIKNNKNILYKIFLLIFGINLFSTGSRTGIALGVMLSVIIFLTSSKIKLKTKVITCFLGILIVLVGFFSIYNLKPEFWQKISSNFIRMSEVKNFSGRTKIWNSGIELLKEKPQNILFGIGRFKSVEAIENLNGRTFTQFHNIYIDLLTTGGIMELIYIGFIYFSVIKSIMKSNLDKKYKSTYIAMFITYAIYIALESFGRFSIGASDTICLISFITIPILHANSIKENEKEEIEK